MKAQGQPSHEAWDQGAKAIQGQGMLVESSARVVSNAQPDLVPSDYRVSSEGPRCREPGGGKSDYDLGTWSGSLSI